MPHRYFTSEISGDTALLTGADAHHLGKVMRARIGEQVILCERGIRTFENSMRNTLDISAVPMLKHMSHLPVVIDPSHAAGIKWMVEPLAKAAVAAGADGLMIEVHNDPARARCDGAQSLTCPQFDALMQDISREVAFFGKQMN